LARQSALDGGKLWQGFLAESKIEQYTVDLLIDLLQLQPAPQWYEALRVRVLPLIPERITMVNPQIWDRTLASFENNLTSELDSRRAATDLLFDTWLYLIEYHDSKKDSPFARLAELTCAIDHPALRLVHCIRDLAYGEEEREQALMEMVESEDPAMKKLLVDCCWRDP